MNDHVDSSPNIRQIQLSNLNESVNLTSSCPSEDMEYLSNLAVDLLHKIKNKNGR